MARVVLDNLCKNYRGPNRQAIHAVRNLSLAVEDGELVVHFQPEVSLETGEVIATEALVRWDHSHRGLLYPDAFIPVAEESSLIVAIDRYVLREFLKILAMVLLSVIALFCIVDYTEIARDVREVMEQLKVAEVRRTGRAAPRYELSRRYIPPVVSCDASTVLVSSIRQVYDQVCAASRTLSSHRRDRGAEGLAYGVGDLEQMLTLQMLNQFIAPMQHLLAHGGGHPFDVYGLLAQLRAALTTYSTEEDPFTFPEYAHVDLASCFLPMIESVFRAEGIPLDLAYVPLIESAFKTTALSRAKAKGIWQFMRGTALENGLKHDWYIDERSDPEKATVAAAKYLTTLVKMFDGDWHLAMASYNGGPARVQRAMKRSGKSDFWQLTESSRYLPRETREYVPMILAAIVIAKNPAQYGFDLEPAVPLAYDKVQVDDPIDLRLVAEWTKAPIDDIVASLGPEGRSIPALLTNRDPDRVRGLIASLKFAAERPVSRAVLGANAVPVPVGVDADGLDLAAVRVPSPVNRLLRLPLGAYFDFILAHDRRHLWQARQARAAA